MVSAKQVDQSASAWSTDLTLVPAITDPCTLQSFIKQSKLDIISIREFISKLEFITSIKVPNPQTGKSQLNYSKSALNSLKTLVLKDQGIVFPTQEGSQTALTSVQLQAAYHIQSDPLLLQFLRERPELAVKLSDLKYLKKVGVETVEYTNREALSLNLRLVRVRFSGQKPQLLLLDRNDHVYGQRSYQQPPEALFWSNGFAGAWNT